MSFNWVIKPRSSSQSVRLSLAVRLAALISMLVIVGLMITARTLTPSISGEGTHQQLGLPACSAILLWGIPCPSCGMTTSWAHLARGNFVAAAWANPGGLLLGLIALASLGPSCYFIISGRSSRGSWYSAALALSLLLAIVVSIFHWIARIVD